MKRVLILSVWLFAFALAAVAQTQRVAGIIVTKDNQPAVGAAVVVDGTDVGAVTNIDGKFIMTEVPVSAKKLRVYHVGMKIKEVEVAPTVRIVLEPKPQGFAWNVKTGVSLFSYRKADGIDERAGFTAGIGMEYIFSDYWAVQPSLMVTSKESYYEDAELKAKMNPIYLELPLLAAFKIPLNEDIRFVINAGPYLAMGVGGKGKVTRFDTDEGGTHNYKLFSGDEAVMKRFDIGFQGGIGFELNHFLINVSMQHGFLNPAKKDKEKHLGTDTYYPIGGLFTVGYRL